MNSSINNTVGLGTGKPSPRGTSSNVASMVTSKQLSGYTAETISNTIARENYNTLSLSDTKLRKIRMYVYKMVSN